MFCFCFSFCMLCYVLPFFVSFLTINILFSFVMFRVDICRFIAFHFVMFCFCSVSRCTYFIYSTLQLYLVYWIQISTISTIRPFRLDRNRHIDLFSFLSYLLQLPLWENKKKVFLVFLKHKMHLIIEYLGLVMLCLNLEQRSRSSSPLFGPKI